MPFKSFVPAPLDQDTYANIFSYISLPLSRDIGHPDLDVVVMGVPFDLATTGRSGTRFGPTGIRQASSQLRWEEKRWPWTFSLSEQLNAIDYGDVVWELGNAHDMFKVVQETAESIIEAGNQLVTLGGDHVIALPLIRAHAKHHGPVALLHFDAHTDNEQDPNPVNHGAMFYHGEKEGVIDVAHSVQVGIRTEYNYQTHPFKVLNADFVNNEGIENTLKEIKTCVGDKPVYLSFDIDCLDPAFAPGTGTPVMGGLSSNQALQIIRGLTGLNIIGCDLVEVAPAYDHADVTSLAGATLVLEMLHVLAANKKDL